MEPFGDAEASSGIDSPGATSSLLRFAALTTTVGPEAGLNVVEPE
jgi:hypothetical protein